MPVTHERWLVALSLLVAIQGAYVGLSLAVRVSASTGARRRLLLVGAAFSLALAIWSMHFVGMLAVRVPFPVDYLVLPTLLSFLVCVIVVGVAVLLISIGPPRLTRLAMSACLMGGGIFSMHYIGMTALHASAHLVHAPFNVAASMVVAIAASGLALWLAAGRSGGLPLALSATVFGLAISGMHYTAMAGLTLFAHESAVSAPALSSDLLAIVVAVVAFIVSGIFLLFLVPERTRLLDQPADAGPTMAAAVAAQPESSPEHRLLPQGVQPLGGAGTAPRRLAHKLPVERDGMTHFVAVDDIVAVHANAHYTYIFNGTAKLFCPLPISDVEQRLDRDRFARVHRSHIVNLDRVVRLKRAGDGGLVELAAADRYSVPIARSRVGWLKTRIGSKTQTAAE